MKCVLPADMGMALTWVHWGKGKKTSSKEHEDPLFCTSLTIFTRSIFNAIVILHWTPSKNPPCTVICNAGGYSPFIIVSSKYICYISVLQANKKKLSENPFVHAIKEVIAQDMRKCMNLNIQLRLHVNRTRNMTYKENYCLGAVDYWSSTVLVLIGMDLVS